MSDVTLANVVEATAEVFGLASGSLQGRVRLKTLSHARNVAYAVARRLQVASFPEIGDRFGGRDHTTILAGVQRHEAKCRTDHELRYQEEAVVALAHDLARLRFTSRRAVPLFRTCRTFRGRGA